MSTVVKSAEPCPLCLIQNKASNPLETRPGQFYAGCKAGHQFPDTEELGVLRNQARSLYPMLYTGPEQAKPTDPAVFAGQDIVITAEMKRMIEEVSGIQFTGASDLKGLLFALVQENKDKDSELRSIRATMKTMSARAGAGASGRSVSANQVLVTIPEWAVEGVASQAEHSRMSADDWVAQEVSGYFENYFGGAAPRG